MYLYVLVQFSGSCCISQLEWVIFLISLAVLDMPAALKIRYCGLGRRGGGVTSLLSSHRMAGRTGTPSAPTQMQVSRIVVMLTARTSSKSSG